MSIATTPVFIPLQLRPLLGKIRYTVCFYAKGIKRIFKLPNISFLSNLSEVKLALF